MSIFDTALHIPHEPRFFEPVAAGRYDRVTLPLSARPTWRSAAVATLAAVAALASVGVGTAVMVAGGNGALVFGPLFLVGAVIPSLVAATAFHDFARFQPCLVIDQDGVLDRRLGLERMAWAQIVAAELVASTNGIDAVKLTLDHDGAPRFNPSRVGGWRAEWSHRRRVRTIALRLLDARSHVLAHTILVLAQRHGVQVEQPSTVRIAPIF